MSGTLLVGIVIGIVLTLVWLAVRDVLHFVHNGPEESWRSSR